MERILGGEPVSATASAAVSTASVSTARDLLLNGDGELSQALAHPNVEAGLGRLGDAAGRAVDHEIAALLERLLDIELVDVLAQGWRKHATLTAAARRTLAESDAREVVGLPTHRVHLEHEPSLELMVDGVQTGQVERRCGPARSWRCPAGDAPRPGDSRSKGSRWRGGQPRSTRGGPCLARASSFSRSPHSPPSPTPP
jgi:hypothetical protein